MSASRRLFVAASLACAALFAAVDAPASVVVDGRTIPVVDMHLHPGMVGQIPATGRAFTTNAIPDFARLYAPAVFRELLDPWAEHVGIHEQTEWAGVDHAVLYAVYTYETSGWFSNEQLEHALTDPRNVSPDAGRPWAWGFASIDAFGDYAMDGARRVAALETFFETRRDLFIGIKLAHAHQAVAFDDPRFMPVYEVAARHKLPVLLHTGFSPFPGSQTDPRFYDPSGLEQVVTQLDGQHGQGRVDFVLSHVGQGDGRSVAHAIDLAKRHDNVYLEISALARPLLIDEQGNPVHSSELQYPGVLAAIKAQGLAARTLYGSDGPQFSGMGRAYLGKMIDGMKQAGFTTDEIAGVLSGNFMRLYFP